LETSLCPEPHENEEPAINQVLTFMDISVRQWQHPSPILFDRAFFEARLKLFLYFAFLDETGRVQFTFKKQQIISNPFEVSRKNEHEGSSFPPIPPKGRKGGNRRQNKQPF
jgi:hypothetical protein